MRLCYERNKTLRIYIINIVVNEVRILEINILCKELFERKFVHFTQGKIHLVMFNVHLKLKCIYTSYYHELWRIHLALSLLRNLLQHYVSSLIFTIQNIDLNLCENERKTRLYLPRGRP